MARLNALAREVDAFKLGLRGSRTQIMAQAAHMAFAEAQAINRAALGYEPEFQQIVDGRENAPLESVKPGGTIVYLFAVGAATLTEALDEGIRIFLQIAPIGSPPEDPHPGLYRNSLALLVNNVPRDAVTEVNATAGGAIELRDTDEVALTNLLPYARKIERGLSSQSPNGVLEVVYAALKARYGNVLNVIFTWDSYPGFEIGRGRRGASLASGSSADRRRAARYPTVRLRVK